MKKRKSLVDKIVELILDIGLLGIACLIFGFSIILMGYGETHKQRNNTEND